MPNSLKARVNRATAIKDVLVAMNPAALITNLKDLVSGGLVIVNTGAFTDKNMARAGYKENPLEDGSLDAYRVISIDITKHKCWSRLNPLA